MHLDVVKLHTKRSRQPDSANADTVSDDLQVFFLPFNMAFANAMVTLFVFDSAEFVREWLWDEVCITTDCVSVSAS